MNSYDIVVLAKPLNEKEYKEVFILTNLEFQNKKAVEQYVLRNDFQQYTKIILSQSNYRKQIKYRIIFKNKVVSEFEQLL